MQYYTLLFTFFEQFTTVLDEKQAGLYLSPSMYTACTGAYILQPTQT